MKSLSVEYSNLISSFLFKFTFENDNTKFSEELVLNAYKNKWDALEKSQKIKS